MRASRDSFRSRRGSLIKPYLRPSDRLHSHSRSNKEMEFSKLSWFAQGLTGFVIRSVQSRTTSISNPAPGWDWHTTSGQGKSRLTGPGWPDSSSPCHRLHFPAAARGRSDACLPCWVHREYVRLRDPSHHQRLPHFRVVHLSDQRCQSGVGAA